MHEIAVEETPNPETLKFLPGQPVALEEPVSFASEAESLDVPIASKLFAVEGVQAVFLGQNFVSVTKKETASWESLRDAIINVLQNFFASEACENGVEISARQEHVSKADEGTVERQIQDLLDERVRPFVAQDGGDIVFKKFADGIAYLEMRGACSGCPSAAATLKQGVENLLRHYIPQVQAVEPA